ncbi:alpha/beta hydrolase family protein [Propionibacteriaceae bacterium Y1685]|uniref:alpha/beta hydrolase family protein n=1 Tax=Microlunatus sp. Y1700 TaxID=3418487 RepID=UPI003B7D1A03
MAHGFPEPGPEAVCAEEDALSRLLTRAAPAPQPILYGNDPDQVYEAYGPTNGPVVMVVHGGYFRPTIDRTHARPMARALADSGVRVVLAEYRRTPGRPDHSTDDLAALEDHLADHDQLPCLWVGHSAGGQLVLQRATDADRPAVPVIALAPVTGLIRAAVEGLGNSAVTAWMGGTPEELPDAYRRSDPQVRLTLPHDQRPDILLLHGTDDVTVPVTHSVTFDAPSTILSGAHHFDLVDPESSYWPRVLAAVLDRVS